jgi:pimeloyl-ACP methyl ester carboxylesterase
MTKKPQSGNYNILQPAIFNRERAGSFSRAYWLRLTRLFAVGLAAALLFLPAALGAVFTAGLLFAPCYGDPSPTAFGLAGTDVTIPTPTGDHFAGFFVAGHNGAAIIIPPTLAAGRTSRLREAAMLTRHGYSVLTFDSRRCAGRGPLSLGYYEADDIIAAAAYLQNRSQIDSTRLGVYGFSAAGAAGLMAAARQPALRAVVAEGGYANFAAETLTPTHPNRPIWLFQALFGGAVRFTYRLITGVTIDRLNPEQAMPAIAPRPVLLIYGSREVSLGAGRRQKEAGGPTVSLWLVPEADHGTYFDTVPAEYEARITDFFDRALR